MPKKSSWTDEQLIQAVNQSKSYRSVIKALGLVPAGGNYVQIQYAIKRLEINTSHFTGMGWNKGTRYSLSTTIPIEEHLVLGSRIQSYKLKTKLFQKGLKTPQCELCGWAKVSSDGRIPVELDHINGERHDNRLENLRILCPNCHSLQSTHRGRNKKVRLVSLQK